MRIDGNGNNPVNKVKGNIVINLYGGTVEGNQRQILSCEEMGEVDGNVTVNIYKDVNIDPATVVLKGQSHKITGTSTLNLYNFTAGEVSALSARIQSNSVYTAVNSVTGTAPTFTPPYDLSAPAPVVYKGVQSSTVADNKFNVRFVATVDALDYDSVGFEITANYTEGGTAAEKEFNKSCSYVYTKLTGKTEAGLQEYTVEDLGGNYILALTITDVPADLGTITFHVKPYAVQDGNKIYGASYTVVYNNGVLVSQTQEG